MRGLIPMSGRRAFPNCSNGNRAVICLLKLGAVEGVTEVGGSCLLSKITFLDRLLACRHQEVYGARRPVAEFSTFKNILQARLEKLQRIFHLDEHFPLSEACYWISLDQKLAQETGCASEVHHLRSRRRSGVSKRFGANAIIRGHIDIIASACRKISCRRATFT